MIDCRHTHLIEVVVKIEKLTTLRTCFSVRSYGSISEVKIKFTKSTQHFLREAKHW